MFPTPILWLLLLILLLLLLLLLLVVVFDTAPNESLKEDLLGMEGVDEEKAEYELAFGDDNDAPTLPPPPPANAKD